MNIINGITNQPTQVMGITIADGSRATFTLYFRPQQNGWFYDLQWPGSVALPVPFQCQNRRLVAAGNVLRQFRDILPFGLGVFSVDNTDPITQACFVDGSVTLALLNADDVANVEATVYVAP